jgi:hypothetical protein
VSNNEWIVVSGFTASSGANNGTFKAIGAGTGTTVQIQRFDGTAFVVEAAGPSVTIKFNPVDTDSAIIIDDNSDVDIAGNVSGNPTISFDFDYDNNVQGGRTAGVAAPFTARAIGLATAQFIEVTGSITASTANKISFVSSLERNYSNV